MMLFNEWHTYSDCSKLEQMKFDISSIQYMVTANDRYFIHSGHLTLRETEKYFSAYLLDWKINVRWIDSC